MCPLASAKMGYCVDSVLPYWLGLWEPSQVLEQAFCKLQEIKPIVERQQPKIAAHSDEDETEADDQWDKEDIDEIQGKCSVLFAKKSL